MAFTRDFSNTIADKTEKKREITKLTELTEHDTDTIFHLIFSDQPAEQTTRIGDS